MHVILLLTCTLLSFVCCLDTKVDITTFGYHDKHGIPLAKRIRDAEDAYMESAEVNRVVGGSSAPENAYPYLGGLVIRLNNTETPSACGSTLLTSNRLVTAAHCWWDGRNWAWQFIVVLGSNMLFFGGTRISTSQVVMHPQWTALDNSNDVAIIHLAENVPYSQVIRPVVLPSLELHEESFAGWTARAAGFGRKTDGASLYLEVRLHHVELQVITVDECAAIYNADTVTNETVCTNGDGGVGVCHGDSGGPLVVTRNGRDILVGISIFAASRGCQLGFPSGYARVTSHYNFILRNLW